MKCYMDQELEIGNGEEGKEKTKKQKTKKKMKNIRFD